MPLISADYIFNSSDGLLKDHCLSVSDTGIIQELRPIEASDEVFFYEGILTPGFINAHCHLELSAMKNQVKEGTGMTGFIREIFAKRQTFTDKENMKAAAHHMKKMWLGGTVGVADICNTLVSLSVKYKFPELFTYSFIELLGLAPGRLELELLKGHEYLAEFETEGMQASITPHAPYSMGKELLKQILSQKPERLSIHLLESRAEREIFEKGTGDFTHFYEALQLGPQKFSPKNPIDYVLKGISGDQPMILVHNTEMKKKEISKITSSYSDAFFCLCPRSNYFIHRTYPDIASFDQYTDRICLGTDSLASNYDLDVFEEAKCVHEIAPEIPLSSLLDWLTYQGAKAIGQQERLGKFRKGAIPGVNLIRSVDLKNLQLKKESRVKKVY